MARILVTGSTQGIGSETARQLIAMGHSVVTHARDASRVDATNQAVPGALEIVVGNLASIGATIALAEQANALGPFDAIIHNAGLGPGSEVREQTGDGLERIFHTNVVGPFIVTALMPIAPRMVYLTSGREEEGRWTPEDLQWTAREWRGMQAYSDSKLHDSMLAVELAARHPESIVNAVDPGWIKTRMGGAGAPDPLHLGAETQVWLATSDDPGALESGRYVKRREEQVPNPAVRDAAARAALIAELERLTGIALP